MITTICSSSQYENSTNNHDKKSNTRGEGYVKDLNHNNMKNITDILNVLNLPNIKNDIFDIREFPRVERKGKTLRNWKN